MNLNAGTFRIELLPRRRVDDEDWVRVQLIASAPGFAADFEAWLQLEDLRRFKRQVEAIYSTLAGVAELSSAEPDICLKLAAASMGQVLGTYRFESEYREGGATILSGAVELDQSYLPALAASVENLISDLSHENVA
jgi:hypothetical protein